MSTEAGFGRRRCLPLARRDLCDRLHRPGLLAGDIKAEVTSGHCSLSSSLLLLLLASRPFVPSSNRRSSPSLPSPVLVSPHPTTFPCRLSKPASRQPRPVSSTPKTIARQLLTPNSPACRCLPRRRASCRACATSLSRPHSRLDPSCAPHQLLEGTVRDQTDTCLDNLAKAEERQPSPPNLTHADLGSHRCFHKSLRLASMVRLVTYLRRLIDLDRHACKK